MSNGQSQNHAPTSSSLTSENKNGVEPQFPRWHQPV